MAQGKGMQSGVPVLSMEERSGPTDTLVDEALAAIRQRQMVLPALLFLAGHRPLAFVLGQMLLILQPLAAIFGADGLAVWSELLSQPAGPTALTERLVRLLDEGCNAPLLERDANGQTTKQRETGA